MFVRFRMLRPRLAFVYLAPIFTQMYISLHTCTYQFCIYRVRCEGVFFKWVKASFAQQLFWPTFARCVLFVKDLRQDQVAVSTYDK